MSATGSATTTPLHVFAERAGARATGIVTVSKGRLRRLFCLEEGRLVFAASNMVEEQFEERLVEERLLEPAHRNAAKLESARRGVKLAAYLHEHKVVSPDRLQDALERHVRGLVEAALTEDGAEAAFAAGRPDLSGELRVDLGASALALGHAMRLPWTTDQLRVAIGPPDARPRRADSVERVVDGLPLDPSLRRLLDLCDGTRSVGDLLAEEGLFDDEGTCLRAIHGLIQLGALTAHSASRTKSTAASGGVTRNEALGVLRMAEAADCYGVLGVDRNTDNPAIRDAYYYLARRYHPDRFRSGELQDLVPQVEKYFSKVTEAYNTLIDAERRSAYDAEQAKGEKKEDVTTDPATLARQNFARAKVLLGKKRFTDAVTFLENAVQLDDSRAEYHRELGELLARNPRRRDDAERELLRAAELDPATADTYFALGELYVRMGRPEDARRKFEEVLRWDPSHADARQRLKGGSGSTRKRGIFGG